jgi:hypothetical protein
MASLKQWVKEKKTACTLSVTEVSHKGQEFEENTQQKMRVFWFSRQCTY